MKRKMPLSTLLNRLSDLTRNAYDADRKAHPERFTGSPDGIGPDFLFVENVARMLACNVDLVRRIPRNELPASKIGNRLIYARADIEAYIRARRAAGTGRYVAIRKAAVQRVANSPEKHPPQSLPFDPVAHVGALLKDRKS